MGHFFSRAIKRLTFGNGGGANSSSSSNTSISSSKSASRNQLRDTEGQQDVAHGQSSTSSQRESELTRPTVQAIPVGQSIDSAEYAAFENASSALPKRDHDRQTTRENSQLAPTASLAPQEIAASLDQEICRQDDKENATLEESDLGDQSKQPEVEEAVIKIQALVRGHLTRKALKDAQHQAASVAPNALGQRQFDEESLFKNPPSAIFLPTSPLSSSSPTQEAINNNNNSIQQQQQSNKHHANPRVPPLESIAEDEVDEIAETTNSTQETPSEVPTLASPVCSVISEEGERRRLSAARKLHSAPAAHTDISQSSNDASSPPSSPQLPSTANASIDIHCDTPASSVSIDIVDHTSVGPMGFGLASVLHPQHNTTVSQQTCPESVVAATTQLAINNGNQLQADADDDDEQVNVLPDISGIPTARGSAVTAFENNGAAAAAEAAAAEATASSLPASPPHINLAATINSHSIDSAEAAAIRIQSAFRGYHTRKHSPYRRRRAHMNGLPSGVINSSGPQTNGYSIHPNQIENGLNSERVQRNLLLRQQDATVMDEEEEELDMDQLDEEDEGVVGGRLMDEDVENTNVLADEEQQQQEERQQQHEQDQRLVMGSELESDDIERRDPSGRVSEQPQDMLPRIGNIDSFEHDDEQPALVSSSSFEDDQRQPTCDQEDGQANNERLEVVSPDEAIESGRSSPALASDHSSDDDDDDGDEHGSSGGGESPQLATESGGQQEKHQQPNNSGGGNKSKKRNNRNKRRGKK